MSFQPQVNQTLTIGDTEYRIAEHPAASGIPYGQEGRQATVYQLISSPTSEGEAQEGQLNTQALKVFKPRYRLPEMVSVAEHIAPYARLQGLQVCRRTVLTPQLHTSLLREYSDLTYAVLMPWIEGPTWMEVIGEKRVLSPEESLSLARSLTETLTGMEQRRLAHCDLSGPNVMMPALAPSGLGDFHFPVALVDVEQLYGPGLDSFEFLPSGSQGYAHRDAKDGLWDARADRFAGAILLVEILGWCDDRVREAAWGESYFDPQEMQRESERYRLLLGVMRNRWGADVARLFERAWQSKTLADCATFGEWLVVLPEKVPSSKSVERPVQPEQAETNEGQGVENTLQVLISLARQFEEQGNLGSALHTYQQAQMLAPAESGLREELAFVVQRLEASHSQTADSDLVSTAKETVSSTGDPQKAEATVLDQLFVEGLAAYKQEELKKAQELLTEVVRRRPDYVRGEQKAADLLSELEKKLNPSHPSVPRWVWLVGCLTLVALALGVGLVLKRAGSSSADTTPTLSAATPITPVAENTPQPTATEIQLAEEDTPEPSATPTHTPTPLPTSTPASEFAPVPTIASVSGGLNTVYYYAFNTETPPFNDTLVRQAFASAIPRASMCQIVNDLYPERRCVPATTFVPPEIMGADLYGQVGMPYDPQRARQLLAQAGHSNGFGLPPITLWYNETDGGGNRMTAEAIQEQWQEVLGVEVELRSMPWNDYLDMLSSAPPQIHRMSWLADYVDPYHFLHDALVGNSDYDFGWDNPDYSVLLQQAAEEQDEDQRRELYIQAERILCETDAVVIPLFHHDNNR